MAGLYSVATGIPRSFFELGFPSSTAHAADLDERQYLVLLSHSDGDPINANAPGAYGIDGVYNNPRPEMAPVDLQLGSFSTRAAAPWATLPQWVLDQTSFIHHRTYQNTHPNYGKVLGLVGSAKASNGSGSEQLPSVFSSENAAAMQSIQVEPVSLSGGLSFEGRSLASIPPSTLAQMFRLETGRALELEQLRVTALDEIHQVLRRDGTPEQRRWIDRYAASQRQVRELDSQLLERLNSISGNGTDSQIDAALTLILLNVSPVMRIHVPFGGDNHSDVGLVAEANQTVSGMASLRYLFEQIDALGLRDRVTVANLHTFGRTLTLESRGGRNHNLNHHVMMISSTRVNPGVVGRIIPSGNDFGASAIDSVTGMGAEGADIPESETLEAAAKTLATTLGMPADRMNVRIDGGKVIQSVIRQG